MKYLDANVFVIAAAQRDERGQQARAILHQIVRGESAVTSALAFDEMMWTLSKQGQKDIIRPILENLYRIGHLEIRDVPGNIPLLALNLMEECRLKPRDAFHAAMMREWNINEIVSDDADFDRVPGIKRVKI